jgi:anti-sigma B factor antagonist
VPVLCQVVIEALGTGAVRVAIQGELSGPSAYTVDAELRRVEATEPACLVLDLSDLGFIDSAGLAQVLAAHRRALRAGRRLLVVEGSQAVRRLIALTALNRHLELLPDSRSAVAAATA